MLRTVLRSGDRSGNKINPALLEGFCLFVWFRLKELNVLKISRLIYKIMSVCEKRYREK